MDYLSSLSILSLIVIIACSFMVGMNKVGVPTMMLIVPLLAEVMGGKESVGFLLPMLIIADLIAVFYYKREAEKKSLLKIIPWALLGVGIGLLVGKNISDYYFKVLISMIIFSGLIMILCQNKIKLDNYINKWWYSAIFGILGGFSTAVGNAAGPIMIIYFLSFNYSKYVYIGTQAWFFLFVNSLKFPLYFYYWKNIDLESLSANLILLPAILLGSFLGILIVKKIPTKIYRFGLIILTILTALKIII